MGSWPKDVGIIAVEMFIPSQYVDQTELEEYDGVSSGKYTIGLGQQKMSFCSDREDINSLCLTVVKRLLERNNLQPHEIGRLEVGTETILDKSKSVKTVLMQLFEPHGVTDLEGIDTTNACFGGTAALFNAISWVESSAWNGRYAIVVAGDIAVYAKGAARPTGGAGAVALLVGPNAPLVFDRGVRAVYVKHAYDFYKPDLTSEYPIVDGKLSIQCYLSALDNCYQQYCKKAEKIAENTTKIDLNHFDAMLFHTPYCKLVQKSLARLDLNDFIRTEDVQVKREKFANLDKYSNVVLAESYFDRDVEKAFLTHSQDAFDQKTASSLSIASDVGNMYTASLYGGLVGWLISKSAQHLAGSKVGFFSYGSGLAAAMFSISVTENVDQLSKITDTLRHIKSMMTNRVKVAPEKFEAHLALREHNCHKAPYVPAATIDHFFPGTYYLSKVDELHRRFYERIPMATNGHSIL